MPEVIYPEVETKRNVTDYFLMSNLPMTESVEELYQCYCSPDNLDVDIINYVTHDIALYDIPKKLKRDVFYSHIHKTFNSHPFILKLKEHIRSLPGKSLNYGGVVRWIQDNTTTVPAPRAWEMKQDIIVNILYSWICDLDEDYTWETPNHSQIISYKTLI